MYLKIGTKFCNYTFWKVLSSSFTILLHLDPVKNDSNSRALLKVNWKL